LALITRRNNEAALKNLKRLKAEYQGLYHAQYGFWDAVDVRTGAVGLKRFSYLNQGWIFCALVDSQVQTFWKYFRIKE
jgi:hypothetical protein